MPNPTEGLKFDFGGSNKTSGFQFDFSNPQNQEFLRTIQSQLGGLVGKDSGYLQSLPQSVRDKVRALKKLQKDKSVIDKDYKRAMDELEKQYNVKYASVYEKRSQYVNGSLEPKEEDMEPEEDEGIKIEEIQEGTPKKEEEKLTGIPDFWLTVLKHNEEIAEMITPEDEVALKLLKDIKYKPFHEAKKEKVSEEDEGEDEKFGFCLDFEFAENPFFEDKVLTKTYFLTSSDMYGDMYDFAEGTEIKWKSGKNLTVKKVTKTEKKGGRKKGKGGGSPKTITVEEKVDSFFNFFSPNELINEQDPSEEDEQLLEHDYEIGVVIKETIIPNAVLWFTGEIGEDGGFDMGSYDEEEEEEEEDEEFQPAEGVTQPECKQQ